MPNKTNFRLRDEAVRLREIERLPLKEIAARTGASMAACCRWLQKHPLTPDETKKIRGDAARKSLTGRKQSPETIRKRVENSREKIRAKAIERHGGAWAAAKDSGRIKYTSSKPCEKGHVERYVKSRLCAQCEFEKQRDPAFRFRRLCTQARYRAKKDGLEFNLTPQYLREIWPMNDHCPILLRPFKFLTDEPRKRGALSLSPTVDRLTPSLGYVKGNVAIISFYANMLKNDCTDPVIFRRIADWLERNGGFRVLPD